MIISMEDFISKHPLFERWKTLRARKVLCPEWLTDFRAFRAGVGERPEDCKKLIRDDPSRPYGPGNARWGKTPTREETLAYYRAWNRANPETRWAKHLLDDFGMTPADYNRMLAAQGGLCAICGHPENASHKARKDGEKRRLAVDHCHGAGNVRDLLCTNCNTMLGAADDSPARLFAAIQYLAKWGKVAKVS